MTRSFSTTAALRVMSLAIPFLCVAACASNSSVSRRRPQVVTNASVAATRITTPVAPPRRQHPRHPATARSKSANKNTSVASSRKNRAMRAKKIPELCERLRLKSVTARDAPRGTRRRTRERELCGRRTREVSHIDQR